MQPYHQEGSREQGAEVRKKYPTPKGSYAVVFKYGKRINNCAERRSPTRERVLLKSSGFGGQRLCPPTPRPLIYLWGFATPCSLLESSLINPSEYYDLPLIKRSYSALTVK